MSKNINQDIWHCNGCGNYHRKPWMLGTCEEYEAEVARK